MDSTDQTEYKNQFKWRLPMVDSKPPPPEPMVSQYTLSFGTPTPVPSQSLSNSNYSRQSSNDHTDSSLGRASPQRPQEQVVASVAPALLKIAPIEAKKASSVLFSYEPPPRVPSPVDLNRQSEYHAKFKPFDDYVYVEGNGFKKQAQLTERDVADKMVKSWVSEVEERSRQATAYRVRSKNGVAPNSPDTTWDGSHVRDRDLQALALATRLIIADKKVERKSRSASVKPSSRVSNASSRYLNSAPPSLRNETSREAPKSAAAPRAVPRKQMPTKTNLANGQLDKNNNNKSAPAKSLAAKVAEPNSQKVWIKPKKSASKEGDKSGASAVKTANQSEPAKASAVKKEFESEPKSCPLRTTDVKSPEQLAGIKSPSPESWKVSIEKGGLNWVNGSTPVNFAEGGKLEQNEQMVRPVPINGHINDDLYGPLSA